MIIGLGHVKRVGKDTAATALVRDLGYQRRAFADPLKNMALELDPLMQSGGVTVNTQIGRGRLKWVVQGMGWDRAKAQVPEVRTFLQKLGVAARNTFGEDIWIDRALKGLKGGERVVFTDVRFLNEAEAIKALGGKLVRIDRHGHVAEGHISETALVDYDGWDYILPNAGDIEQLEGLIVDWARTQLSASSVDPVPAG